MFDIVGHTQRVINAASVEVTVSRSGEDDRTERAVLWLGAGEFSHGNTNQVASRHLLSALATVDLAMGDQITCDDSRVVTAETTWELVERNPDADDPNEQTWWIQNVEWFEEA